MSYYAWWEQSCTSTRLNNEGRGATSRFEEKVLSLQLGSLPLKKSETSLTIDQDDSTFWSWSGINRCGVDKRKRQAPWSVGTMRIPIGVLYHGYYNMFSWPNKKIVLCTWLGLASSSCGCRRNSARPSGEKRRLLCWVTGLVQTFI